MPYLTNIPAATDKPSVSQQQIQTNFALLDNYFGTNHVQFSALSSQGQHKFVQLQTQAAAPATVGISALYTKAVAGLTCLFWKQGGGTEVQMTSFDPTFSNATTNPAWGATKKGWTYLPGGLLLQWDSVTLAPAPNSTQVFFPRAFSALPWSIVCTMNKATSTPDSVFVDNGAGAANPAWFFAFNTSSTAKLMFYIAIGLA